MAVRICKSDYVLMMTMDAVPKNQRLIEKSKLDEIREILKTVGKPLTELDDETLATVYDLAKL